MNETESFLMVPKELLFSEKYECLPIYAKIIYALMLERRNISVQNKWVDSDGEPYIFFTLETACRLLRISESTALRHMKELERNRIIKKKKQRRGKPDKITVKPMKLESPGKEKYTMATYKMEDLERLMNQ